MYYTESKFKSVIISLAILKNRKYFLDWNSYPELTLHSNLLTTLPLLNLINK